MSELKQILDLWKSAGARKEDVCLASVVAIEGSAYRRPGARMLLTSSGQRAGTVSGGCLEAEIAKKAWWLTERGASVQRYSSFFDDDGDMPYGLGCGGTVIVLLERGEPAGRVLEALRRSVEVRTESVIVTDTNPEHPGTALILNEGGDLVFARPGQDAPPAALAHEVARTGVSHHAPGVFAEFVAPPPALVIFGAGDDAQPLAAFAAALGWHITIADGRANLARAERFPDAARVGGLDEALAGIGAETAAVIMTHSYEQDRKALGALLGREMKYTGILGPRRRTERLVSEVAPGLGLTAEECMARLHTPVGLDLGGHSPAAIALSIAAELQAVFSGRESAGRAGAGSGREARGLSSAPAIHA